MTGQDTSRSLAVFEATFRRFRERAVPASAPRTPSAAPLSPRRGAALQLVERVFD